MDSRLPLALYGAGQRASTEKRIAEAIGIPVCIIDIDSGKHGNEYLGLPVISLDQAKKRYGDFNLHVTLSKTKRAEVFAYLIDNGIPKHRILNYEEVEKYRGCPYLETSLNINEKRIWACCTFEDGRALTPFIEHKGKAEDTVSEWVMMRNRLIDDIRNGEANFCSGCSVIEESGFPVERKIRSLGLSQMSPCQLSCIYCNAPNAKRPYSEEDRQLANSFDWAGLIRHLEDTELVAKDATVGFAGGELTVYPRKYEILDLIEKYSFHLFTNGVVFDGRIAYLTARPGSFSVVSVDAGTRETFKRIKGLDAFNRVWDNIGKYVQHGSNITAKYVFIPDNSNEADMAGFIEEVLKAGVETIQCSFDFNRKSPFDKHMAELVAKMMDIADSHGILSSLVEDTAFSPDEIKMIKSIKNTNRTSKQE